MTVIVNRKVYAERDIVASTDRVFAWAPIPAGGAFLGATVEGSIIGVESSSTLGAMVYGLSGYVVPIRDPDTPDADPDIAWDLMVPKDETIDEDTLDFDWGTSQDATPAQTIGNPNINMLLGMQGGVQKLFRMERIISFANSPTGFIAGTPDAYFPTDTFRFRVKQTARVKTPSAVLFAVSAGAAGVATGFTGDTQGWVPTSENEWRNLRYIGDTLEEASKFIAGGVEAGAHEPWEAAAEMVQRTVEQAHEDTSGAFINMAMNSFTRTTMTLEFPGHFRVNSINGG